MKNGDGFMHLRKEEFLKSNFNEGDKYFELAGRAYDILMGNVYAPDAGFLWSPYRCLTPGNNKFRGIWNWDSAFHAVGLSRWDTELAKESILGFLKFQKADGLLPDVIRETGEIVDAYSKPPVFAWATEILYQRGADIDFVRAVYPKLALNALWWENNRCDQGLFFYDSADKGHEKYLLHVQYESGWDNSPRWDAPANEYWAVDLNCFMILAYRALKSIALLLEKEKDADTWLQKEKALTRLVNEKLWSKENRWYSDAHRFTETVSKTLSPASFMPLYARIASEDQAEAMCCIAKENFKGKMPTVSFDNAAFSDDYWRGPTWLNVAYFAAKGLKNYGFSVADTIQKSILDMCAQDKDGIYENYNSITGKGQYCNRFGWSCVFIFEFLLDF
jgi:putative isomerase